MMDSRISHTLRLSFDELLNEGRVSPRTDHLLWRLEAALGEMPLGPLMDLLEPSPHLAFGEFRELRESLALDALAIWEWENG